MKSINDKMLKCCSFCLISIFLVSVTANQDAWGLFHFSQSQKDLSKCVREHELLKSLEIQDPLDIEVVELIADLVAERFYGKTVSSEDLNYAHSLTDAFRQRHFPQVRADNQIPWEQLERNLKKALIDCSDSVSNSSEFIDLPYFIQEQEDFGQLLDFVLVNWPYFRDQMIINRIRRSLLRKYAHEAENIFRRAYSSTSSRGHNFYTRLKES